MKRSWVIRYLTVCLLFALLTSCGGKSGADQNGKEEHTGEESTQSPGRDEADPDQGYAVIVSAAPSETEITAADIAWVAASGRYPERPDERAAACSRMGMIHGLAVQEGGCVPGGENRRTAPLPVPLSAAMADGCNSGSIHI